jgi:hypothetical protein
MNFDQPNFGQIKFDRPSFGRINFDRPSFVRIDFDKIRMESIWSKGLKTKRWCKLMVW